MIFTKDRAENVAAGAPSGLPVLVRRLREVEDPAVRVAAVGDIGLAGQAAATAAAGSFDELFGDVAAVLHSADVVFGNLEYPLAADVARSKMFEAAPGSAPCLRRAGFSLLHLANNHVAEHGAAGLAATLEGVTSTGITPLGAGRDDAGARAVVRTDRNGVRIGWLGCGRTLEPQAPAGPKYWEFNEQELIDAARTARGGVDVLIVSIHIGLMYMDYPRPDHQQLAHRLIDAGAAVVLMHHAHVLQGVEVHRDGVICYNLGNFLLDWREGHVEVPMVVERQKEGAIFTFEIDRRGVAALVVLPTIITEACTVRWPDAARAAGILDRLEAISAPLLGDFRAVFEEQRAQRNAGPILKVLAVNAMRGNFPYVVRQLRKLRVEHVTMVFRWFASRLRAKA